jgi:cytochrome c peroxidase
MLRPMAQKVSRFLLGCLVPLALVACAQEGDLNEGPYPTENAANALSPLNDLAEGQFYFFRDPAGAEAASPLPPTYFVLDLIENDGTFAEQLVNFGFLSDDLDDFPVGIKRGQQDPERLQITCAACHVAELPDGRRWVGAPNNRVDIGRLIVALNRRWVSDGNPSLIPLSETPERLAAAEQKILSVGPGRMNVASPNHPRVVPMDTPALFRMDRRARFGQAGHMNDARSATYLMTYYLGAGRNTAVEEDVLNPSPAKVSAMVEYMEQLSAPPPSEPNADQVARGKAVFAAARCGTCHNVREGGSNLLVPHRAGSEAVPGDDPELPFGTIATDGARLVLWKGDDIEPGGPEMDGDGRDTGFEDLIWVALGRGLVIGESEGYRVPDLSGVWASAPYLHNGSVPNLRALLSTQGERPATFNRSGFEVNATVWGNLNRGHEFGADLDDSQKNQLIAYLQSL